MINSTSNTYQMKREILTFSNKISKKLSKPEKKFTADMTYGLFASESCLLTDVVDKLHENTKKVNSVERLTRHLNKGVQKDALHAYLSTVKKWIPENPVIHVADSVHPVSIFSHIHSSKEKGYSSTNTITYQALERGAALFGKATFVMDRGYNDNKMFLKLDELKQDYVIRLTAKRTVLFHNKRIPVTQLCNQRKGKIKTSVIYKGKSHNAYLSHVKVQITAARKNIYLVLVYGITEHPMMLATNKEIKSKEDVVNVARLYFSRWRIEEYFRSKKQLFQFENFRVRKLKTINALNFYITVYMGFLAHMTRKAETNALKVAIIQNAAPIKEKVHFHYYRLAKGISGVLSYAKDGIRLWYRTKRPAYRQLCLKLAA